VLGCRAVIVKSFHGSSELDWFSIFGSNE
jgi:hypothetical protein